MIRHYKEITRSEETIFNAQLSDLSIDWNNKYIFKNRHEREGYFQYESEKCIQKETKIDFRFQTPKIGLDIDEVLGDFIGRYQEYFGYKTISNWFFTYEMKKNMEKLNNDKDFWLGIRPRISHHEIPFIPTCYITKRVFPVEWTEEWIEKNNFPCVPVIHVPESKLEKAKEMELEYFIDDNIKNFQELNRNGITTFLMDAVHNKQFDVGDMRIIHLSDIKEKI